MAQIDSFDRKILAALQNDGRLSNNELAEIAGLSASQCSRRRLRLEQDGIIAGYHAVLDPGKVGMGLISMVGVIPIVVGPLMAGIVFDQTDSYSLAFAITIALFVGGAAFMALSRRPRPATPEPVATTA